MTLILTIDPAQDVAEIILKLQRAHIEVSAVMPMLDIIIVEASASDIAAIEIIPGIVAVENDKDIRISYEASLKGATIRRRNFDDPFDIDLDHGFTSMTIN